MTCSGDGDIIIIIIGVEQREMCRVLGGRGSPRAWQKGSAAGVHQGQTIELDVYDATARGSPKS